MIFEKGTLYIVGTPIGNLSDLSPRAAEVFENVDFIAAEDTRVSLKILNHFGIKKPLVSYYEHNKSARGETIAARLEAGESCALVTDAGTPAISDPGEDIVRLCAERGITVTSVPGCCAAVTALTLSALGTRRFCFEGFLPVEKKERRERLDTLASEERTMIFYEAPHKLVGTLDDLMNVFSGERKIALCRELTKMNEDVMRTTLREAVETYKTREPRGEYVLVIDGAEKTADDYPEDIAEHVAMLEAAGLSRMDAIKAAAKARGVKKNDIYAAVAKK